MTDDQYVKAFASNDNVGIRTFYKECFIMAKSYLIQQFNGIKEEDIKDVFQESIIAVWNNITSGKLDLMQNVKLTTYTIQICKYKLLDRMKKKSNQMETSDSEMVARMDIPEELIETNEEENKMKSILSTMPERCRSLLMLFYYEKKKLSEIANELAIGEASIKNEKYRCMKRLKQMYTNA